MVRVEEAAPVYRKEDIMFEGQGNMVPPHKQHDEGVRKTKPKTAKKQKVVKDICPLCGAEVDKIIAKKYEIIICNCTASKGGWVLYRMTE